MFSSSGVVLKQRALLTGIVSLYIVSLTCSVAGMEFFSALFVLCSVLFALWRRFQNQPQLAPLLPLGPDWAILGFVVVGIVSALLVPNLPLADRLDIVGEFRWPLFFYFFYSWMVAQTIETRGKVIERSLILLFGFILVIAAFSFYQVFTGADPFRPGLSKHVIKGGIVDLWRAKGLFRTTMTYSYSFGMVFCFLLSTIWIYLPHVQIPKWQRLMIWSSCVLLGLTLILTFTRGLWLALVVALIAMAAIHERRRALVVLASIFVLAGGLWMTSSSFHKRIESIVSLQNTSNSQRVDLWRINWEMFKDHPLTGVGLNRNDNRADEYNLRVFGERRFTGHAHNHFIQILSGMGIFGLIFFLIIFGSFFWYALQAWKIAGSDPLLQALSLGSIGSQLIFHMGGLTEAVFIDNEILHMYIFLQSLMLAAFWVARQRQET